VNDKQALTHNGIPSDEPGACVSPDPVDNEDAKVWFNCVEEMVFTDDDFCRDIESPVSSDSAVPLSTPANRRKLQALQAAYIVCLYQNWEGTDASKRRIRRHRFSTVVSVRPGSAEDCLFLPTFADVV
jgi:hypothetical protein